MATSRLCCALIGLVVGLAAAPAAAEQAASASRPVPAGEAAAEPPSEALLEFLGTWDADDDAWMGPEFFQALEAADQEQDHDREHD